VGSAIGPALAAEHLPFVVIERDHLMLATAQTQGVPTLEADATVPSVLEAAGIRNAKVIVIATPDGFQARRIVELARQLNPAIEVVVRTHSHSEFKALEQLGANRVVMGERELARGMLEFSLRSLGVPQERARAVAGRDSQVDPEGT
jgi:CPA2 family monovalent cation:H+ antiporter-2